MACLFGRFSGLFYLCKYPKRMEFGLDIGLGKELGRIRHGLLHGTVIEIARIYINYLVNCKCDVKR